MKDDRPSFSESKIKSPDPFVLKSELVFDSTPKIDLLTPPVEDNVEEDEENVLLVWPKRGKRVVENPKKKTSVNKKKGKAIVDDSVIRVKNYLIRGSQKKLLGDSRTTVNRINRQTTVVEEKNVSPEKL